MTGLDPWLSMVHSVQALRRRVERERGALLGALGVAGEALPHQLANVRRILEALEIRHLIADGVGLGKTVQTLMILNVLRLANPDHRSLLVAPDHLVGQWMKEFMTRGHASPRTALPGAPVPEDSPTVIIRPADLVERTDLLREAPDCFDMLIVDEPQTLTVRARDMLLRTRPFAQFLALTATPEFRRDEMRDWFLGMLEPLRCGPALRDGINVLEMVREEERAALCAVKDDRLAPRLAFERDALGRRICRWSRDDWPDYILSREYSRADVPPFAREAARAEVARDVLAVQVESGGTEAGQRTDLIRLAQALHRSGRAAREAVAGLAQPLREKVEAGKGEQDIRGDSRFDALLAHLSRLWAEDPDKRVLLVAGDNGTAEYLRGRLPAYFDDEETGERIGVASLARGQQSAVTAEDAIRSSHEILSGFFKGRDRILLIGEWAEAGLNLQHGCEELVFYTCPWNPRSIDQLVGRLDRLRPGAQKRAAAGRGQGRLGLHVITWKGSPESGIVAGLERLGIFKRPVPPATGETAERIERLLHVLAAGRGGASELELLECIGSDRAFEVALSLLAPLSPHTAQDARHTYAELENADPLPGALPTARPSTARAAEEDALTEWLRALTASRLLDVRFGVKDAQDSTVRFASAWYFDTGTQYTEGERPVTLELFERRSEGDRRATAESGLVGFVLRRKHLADPPRDHVRRKNGSTLALGFADHGDTFHEELCNAFLGRAQEAFSRVTVAYPPGHAALIDRRPILVVVGMRRESLPPLSSAGIDRVLEQADPRDRLWLKRMFCGWCEADERWFRLRCPPRFFLEGAYSAESGGWEEASVANVIARLDPRGDDNQVASARVQKPPAIAGDNSEAERRLGTFAEEPSQGVPVDELADRLHLIDAEFARYAADCEKEAAYHRARATDNLNQRRMMESVAERVEARLGAAEAFAAWRRARLTEAGTPMRRSDNQSRSLLIYAVERS